MTKALHLSVMYADETLGTALGNHSLTLPAGAERPIVTPATRIPGALGGWFELAVSFGVLGIPASILASCIANWITAAIKDRRTPAGSAPKAKLVFSQGGRSVEIELMADNSDTLARAIETTLTRVNPQQ